MEDVPLDGNSIPELFDDECEGGCDEVIDALLVWTPEATSWLSDLGNPFIIALYGSMALESVNFAIDNSGIDGELRFSAVTYNDFVFSPPPVDIFTDINTLANDVTVQGFRDSFSADLVVLMTNQGYNRTFGIVDSIGPSTSDAYAIVEVSSLVSPRWTFAHEIAHLFGARHNRTENIDIFGINGDDTDICSHAWRFVDNNGQERRTALASLQFQANGRELLFSNPGVVFNGVEAGTEDDNNAGRIEKGACEIVDFNPPSYFNASIVGEVSLCRCLPFPPGSSTYEEFRNYVVEVETPNGPNPGLPPYTYSWYWNQSGIFTNSDPGNFIGDAPSITVDVTPCDYFFLHLVVTASDGVVITDTKGIYTGSCNECSECLGFTNDDGIERKTETNKNDNIRPEKLIVKPNPVADNLVLSYTISTTTEVETYVIDINGKIVSSLESKLMETGTYTNIVSIEHLPSGIYLLLQRRGDSYITQKIIKQ